MCAEVTRVLVEDASTQVLSPSPQQKAKTRREEALKILEPLRKKLPSLEAQRISGVLQDSISQVEIVAMLPAVLARLDTLSSGLDNDLSRALREHGLLEERLMRLDSPGSDGGQEGEIGEARERVRVQLERDFQSSLKNVLRLFRTHPEAIPALRPEVDMEVAVSESMQCLINALKKFHGLMLERLMTSPEEERQLSAYMKDVSSRRAHNMKLKASLEAEVAAAIKYRDLEISKKANVIKTLKRSLHQTEKTSEDFVLRTQQDTDKQSQSLAKASEMKQTRLKQEIDQLNVQLNNLILENRGAERVLREKNYKVETEIENLIQKYDADMEEKQVELEELEKGYEEEKEELRRLEEAYAVLEVEYNQIQQERWLAEERRKEEQRDLELKTKAAILAQAWWRGYCIRKAMKGKGKSKKGKKGKGKKGK